MYWNGVIEAFSQMTVIIDVIFIVDELINEVLPCWAGCCRVVPTKMGSLWPISLLVSVFLLASFLIHCNLWKPVCVMIMIGVKQDILLCWWWLGGALMSSSGWLGGALRCASEILSLTGLKR